LLRSTCSSAVAVPDELRAADFWRSFLAGLARFGWGPSLRASTSSSFRIECQPAIPFFLAMLASCFLLQARNRSAFMEDSVGTRMMQAAALQRIVTASLLVQETPGSPFLGGFQAVRTYPSRSRGQGMRVGMPRGKPEENLAAGQVAPGRVDKKGQPLLSKVCPCYDLGLR
jgi:hypothetical protein